MYTVILPLLPRVKCSLEFLEIFLEPHYLLQFDLDPLLDRVKMPLLELQFHFGKQKEIKRVTKSGE